MSLISDERVEELLEKERLLETEIERLRAALEWVEQNSGEQEIAGYAGRALEHQR